MFNAYSGTFAKLHSWLHLSRNICHIGTCFSRFRDIQDPCITGPNSVNKHLLFKSGFVLNHCSNLLEHFFIFVAKVDIQHFALRDSTSIITKAIIITCHPRQQAIVAAHASTPSTQTHHPPYPRYKHWHASCASTIPTPPTYIRNAHIKSFNFQESMVMFRQHLLRKVQIFRI